MGRSAAVDPGRLAKFFDYPGPGTVGPGTVTMSYASGAVSGARRGRYDPSISWDGLSVNPRPFSRLDAKPLTVSAGQKSRASGLAGSQVVELDDARAGGPLVYLSGPPVASAAQVRHVAPTAEQMDVQYTNGRAAEEGPVAAVLAPERAEDAMMYVKNASFRNNRLHAPVIEATVSPPYAWHKTTGTELTTPGERRAAIDLERRSEDARATIRKAQGQHSRLVSIMRNRHQDGALGVDSTGNPESAVYHERHAAQRLNDDKRREHAFGRSRKLATISIASNRVQYKPMHHTDEQVLSRREADAFRQMQSKGRNAATPTVVPRDTHQRVFGFRDEGVRKLAREQNLRNEDIGGKSHSITSHARIDFAPSTAPERYDRRLAHPSQQSLERGRHMQGSLVLG